MPWIDTASASSPIEIFPDWFLLHWSRLSLVYPSADPFCFSPAWSLPFHHIINHGRRLFYDASPEGAIIFGEHHDVTGSRILVPVEDGWLYGTPLLGPEAPFLLAERLAELQEGQNSPVFVSGMIAAERQAANLYRVLSPDFKLYRHNMEYQQSASLAGGVDGWLSRRSANTRANMRKSLRRAANLGLVFERVKPDLHNFRTIYDRILAVESKSWKGRDHCGMLESPSCELYGAMLEMLAQIRSALIIFAIFEGEDVGFIFGGLHGPFYRGQQFSFSESFRNYSIGNMLQYEKILWLSELGCLRYDMGPANGPRMEYKRRWTEERQEFQTWALIPRS